MRGFNVRAVSLVNNQLKLVSFQKSNFNAAIPNKTKSKHRSIFQNKKCTISTVQWGNETEYEWRSN